MNIKSFLKTVGLGLISSNPMGAAALTVINGFLPDDKKLPENATGEQAQDAIKSLSPDQLAQLELAEIHLAEVEEEGRTARYIAMCAAEGQETRAKVVLIAIWGLISTNLLFMLVIAWVYVERGASEAFSPSLIGTYTVMTGTLAYVVRAYMGDLRSETRSRHETIDEKPRKPGLLEVLLSRK